MLDHRTVGEHLYMSDWKSRIPQGRPEGELAVPDNTLRTAARKPPVPIGGKKAAGPNRRQESRRSQSATRKSPLPVGGKKAAAPVP